MYGRRAKGLLAYRGAVLDFDLDISRARRTGW